MNDPAFIGLDSQDPARVVLGSAFESHTLRNHDTSLHYVSGGSGPAIIFLHGFSHADMRHYASAYEMPAQLRAGLGLYRTYGQNQAFMRAHRDELQVPILLLEGDYGSGKPGSTAKELADQFGCRNVSAQVVAGCGHLLIANC